MSPASPKVLCCGVVAPNAVCAHGMSCSEVELPAPGAPLRSILFASSCDIRADCELAIPAKFILAALVCCWIACCCGDNCCVAVNVGMLTSVFVYGSCQL